MINSSCLIQSFSTWLGSIECSWFLDSCREKIRSRALIHGLEISQESLEAGSLWTFLASRNEAAQKVYQFVVSGNLTQARYLFANYYILHLIDLRRAASDSAFHSTYRKARTLLSRHPDFSCVSDRKGSYYAHGVISEDSPVIKSFSGRETNYQLLPDPDVGADCTQNEYIETGAVLFYSWACESLHGRAYYPVRELTAYLMTRPEFNREIMKIITISDLETGRETSEDLPYGMDSFPSRNISCPQLSGIVEPALEDIARSMVKNWSTLMATAFYMHSRQEMSLDTIAGTIGYKSASGVKYQLALAREDIQRHTAPWPLLSPPDLDEKVFARFLEHVFIFCKQKTSCRNMDQLDAN